MSLAIIAAIIITLGHGMIIIACRHHLVLISGLMFASEF
jgi:hypothetical protein